MAFNENGFLIYQCKDCEHLGNPVKCEKCAGGQGWPCKIDKNGQHVHPDMRACDDFKMITVEEHNGPKNTSRPHMPKSLGITQERRSVRRKARQ